MRKTFYRFASHQIISCLVRLKKVHVNSAFRLKGMRLQRCRSWTITNPSSISDISRTLRNILLFKAPSWPLISNFTTSLAAKASFKSFPRGFTESVSLINLLTFSLSLAPTPTLLRKSRIIFVRRIIFRWIKMNSLVWSVRANGDEQVKKKSKKDVRRRLCVAFPPLAGPEKGSRSE